jgi:uncharacterized membrane protein
MPYEFYLYLHVLSACLFIGSILICTFWKINAERTGDVRIIRFALRSIFFADGFITIPSVAVLYFSGVYIAGVKDLDITLTPWIHYSIILLGASGIIWMAGLVPLQILQVRSLDGDAIGPKFRLYARLWLGVAIVAKILPLTILVLMIFRSDS